MDEESVPSREICEERIDNFVDATKSNSAVAQQFLQDCEWDLDRAVFNFFKALAKETADCNVADIASDVEDVGKQYTDGKIITSVPPPSMRVLSWNLDCIDVRSLKRRMMAVVSYVQRTEPDVVFFQEVTNLVADYFDAKLPEYHAIRGNSGRYYTMVLLRVFTIRYDSHEIIPYPGTRMGRNLLKVSAHIGNRKFVLLNSHLESCKDHSEERKRQLVAAFRTARNVPSDITVIFGGDLNLRDSELLECVPVLEPFFDAWEACGSRKEMQFTWDTQRNSNKEIGDPENGYGPRCRFDRLYIRPEINHVRIEEFCLVGAERAANSPLFPSDHWGILIFLKLVH